MEVLVPEGDVVAGVSLGVPEPEVGVAVPDGVVVPDDDAALAVTAIFMPLPQCPITPHMK